jgi:hypothetical protein
VGQVSFQIPWSSPTIFPNTLVFPYQYHSTNVPYSFIRLSLMLYNLCNCQPHYSLNTKINIIIINGRYSKNEFDICICMKVTAYWRKWQNEGFSVTYYSQHINSAQTWCMWLKLARTEMRTWLLQCNLGERDWLRDLAVNGIILLNCIIMPMCWPL